MTGRTPEPWETSAAGAFVTMPREHGTVSIWRLGSDWHRVVVDGAPELAESIEGYDAARARAHSLAERLGPSTAV